MPYTFLLGWFAFIDYSWVGLKTWNRDANKRIVMSVDGIAGNKRVASSLEHPYKYADLWYAWLRSLTGAWVLILPDQLQIKELSGFGHNLNWNIQINSNFMKSSAWCMKSSGNHTRSSDQRPWMNDVLYLAHTVHIWDLYSTYWRSKNQSKPESYKPEQSRSRSSYSAEILQRNWLEEGF